MPCHICGNDPRVVMTVALIRDGTSYQLCARHYDAVSQGFLDLNGRVTTCSADGCTQPAVNFVSDVIGFCRDHGLDQV